ncbi:dematin-like [Lepeophtheirus salmonis]|uniref:dematin-like n=1 Tax=Lepeophtheirus salmonis TaxID=72036 RepID=UPI00077F1AFD|nr:dematin-like [Lepeophtheirus salmonis]
MCTVLQQTLGDRSRDYGGEDSGRRRHSPVRLSSDVPTYSYLADLGTLKRPIDPSDRKISHPNMHFHVPPEGSHRSRSSYISQLYGRSRSASRTGMRLLVDYMRSTTPRPKSPYMNNEEAIGLAHYPDGKHPEEDKPAPIERDDFPAPPFSCGYNRRKRHWSEPGLKVSSPPTPPTPSTPEEDEEEDPQLEKSEKELKKISTAMGQIFLTEIAIEKERRKSQKGRYIDPRSAARSPAANKEPLFKLRYESPINASPSRIADHLHPWEDDGRRSCITPYSPSPAPPKPKSHTLPSRFSPFESTKVEEVDFSSKSDVSSGDIHYGERPRSGCTVPHICSGNKLQASTIYPAHLLFTTNYRLPGDVDRCNIEKHLSDHDFDLLFECSRLEFYQLAYWKRSELKKKYYLF